MPAVTTLHQDSETSGKPSFFRGHHWGCIAVVVQACDKFFATPLWAGRVARRLPPPSRAGDALRLARRVSCLDRPQVNITIVGSVQRR